LTCFISPVPAGIAHVSGDKEERGADALAFVIEDIDMSLFAREDRADLACPHGLMQRG